MPHVVTPTTTCRHFYPVRPRCTESFFPACSVSYLREAGLDVFASHHVIHSNGMRRDTLACANVAVRRFTCILRRAALRTE